jgi:Rps23 Pro-64 3,4-dihydroxylase Tpa1-like proline 4-hydroxylase
MRWRRFIIPAIVLIQDQQQIHITEAFILTPISSPSRRTTLTASTRTKIHQSNEVDVDVDVDDDIESGGEEYNLNLNIDTATDTPSFTYPSSSSSSWPSLPGSSYTQVMSSLDLQPMATILRQRYDEHFQDPRQPDETGKRFCWDPWFVKVGDGLNNSNSDVDEDSGVGDEDDDDSPHTQQRRQPLLEGEKEAVDSQTQYSLKRIQSNIFFEQTEFSNLVESLTVLGRSIGLTAITPPWISLYTSGDRQNFHTDAPQGPLAFVLSLSSNSKDFTGGETMILQPHILDMWRSFDTSKGLEMGSIVRYIPPTPLGKCIVFDPRVPHGVNVVEGTMDPRKGRVAIHGWFNQPEVCWFGPWGESEDDTVVVERMNVMLDEALQPLVGTLGSGEIGRVLGYLACRVEVDKSGYVDEVRGVCDTLQADYDDFRGVIGYDESDRPVMEDAVSDVKLTIYETLKNLFFEEGESGRSVVVPFAFE